MFQIILISVFVVFIIAGILAFSLYRGGSANQTPAITIWGTLDQTLMDTFITQAATSKANIHYVQKNPTTFNSDLVNAIATGQGPDVIVGTQDQIFSNRALLTVIPYSAYPERTFISTYIPEAGIYLKPQGELAIPLAVDPLVMYWNRALFSNADIIAPPATWEQLIALIPRLSIVDKAYNVSQSAVGMGDYANINNAKAIVSLLLMQAGNNIVTIDPTTGNLSAVIGDSSNSITTATTNVLSFYTQFANPTSPSYSWNRSLANSQDLFLSNQLALYFGFASEYNTLAQKNPNLDFDVAVVPQVGQSSVGATASINQNSTFGNLYGFAILHQSPNASAAFLDISKLTSSTAAATWSALAGLPSARLDSLSSNPANPISPIFNQSALWARGWPDPNAAATDQIFESMIDSITSSQADPSQAIITAQGQLGALLH